MISKYNEAEKRKKEQLEFLEKHKSRKFTNYKDKQKFYRFLNSIHEFFWNSKEKGTYIKPKEDK